MKILVLNCGSSSLKYQVFDMTNESVLAKGVCERIGLDKSIISHKGKEEFKKKEAEMKNHKDAIQIVLDTIVDETYGVLSSLDELDGVAHRVVHGGDKFSGSVVITDEVIAEMKKCVELAPLHNPPGINGIEAVTALLPNIKQTGSFDTSFHQTMPEKAYIYAIPYKFYEKYGIRRYGFHGSSHVYVSAEAAKLLGKPIEELKIITAHLGNGSSVTAVKHGKSIDTSMGLTPLEGLAMGTRSGDIDPAIIEFLAEKEGLTAKEVVNILNKESGVLGISEVSSDFRDIEDEAPKGNKKAQLALDVFYYRVAKYIGAYVAAMNGVDAIVFTAGLGENSPEAREEVCAYLGYLGIEIDKEVNKVRGKTTLVSKSTKPAVYTIPTNEELVLARECKMLI
ncbi:MAG: acetate kinase [Defluviitaleaceae bacterium]|nr:acetate kinase [Defluviitaleaceae bacterium]